MRRRCGKHMIRLKRNRGRLMKDESVHLSVVPLLKVSDDLIVTLSSERRG